MLNAPLWRPLQSGDLAAVVSIANAAFPFHPEAPAYFAERLALSPDWCFGLEDGADCLAGYLIAYPWLLNNIPPLNARLGILPDQRTSLFLHDLALRAGVAGGGRASAGVEHLVKLARAAGLTTIALVAVNETVGFWRRNGFRPVADDPCIRAKLASYGEGSAYMLREISPQLSSPLMPELAQR